MSQVTIAWVRYTAAGEEETIQFPAVFVVCHTCEGKGKTVNPSIDGNGITAAEMAELGDDFREDYMAGVYDVQCRTCKGERVVAQLDRAACNRNPKLKALLKLKDKEERDDARDYDSERWLRMAESGERW